LELEYLEATAPVGVLESLERAGLVTIAVAEGEVRLAHPLHGTVVRAVMPRSRARAILLAQAARLESAGPAGPAALRIAVWRPGRRGPARPGRLGPRRAPGPLRVRLPDGAAADRVGTRCGPGRGRGAAAGGGAVRAGRLRRRRAGPGPRPAAPGQRAHRPAAGGHP